MIINSRQVRAILKRKLAQLSNLDSLFKELASRVISRLEYVRLSPQRILDCGGGRGLDRELLKQKYPQSQLVELDMVQELLPRHTRNKGFLAQVWGGKNPRSLLCGDANYLPLANASIDFYYANLLIPYLGDPQRFIKEMRRVLNLGGAFCISGLGVDSLKEIRALGLSTYTFPDMHDIGDMLIAAGFSNPVVDSEYITLEYDELQTLLNDVRIIGCGAAKPGAAEHGYLGKGFVRRLNTLAKLPSRLTLEIFVAHGWKDSNQIDLPAGYSPINFPAKSSR